jgi:hypothetical protein
VRRFGWLHPAARKRLNRVRALLGQAPSLTVAEKAAWLSPEPDFEPTEPLPTAQSTPLCPNCQSPMVRVGRCLPVWSAPASPARAPP